MIQTPEEKAIKKTKRDESKDIKITKIQEDGKTKETKMETVSGCLIFKSNHIEL